MSDLILCAKGGRFGGDRALGDSKKGRFVHRVFTGEADTACWRWTQARAACRRVPFLQPDLIDLIFQLCPVDPRNTFV